MSKQHTPGPWLYRGKNAAVHKPSADPVYRYGEQIFRFHDEDDPSDADLDLILAAPELLTALEWLMVECDLVSEDAVNAYANARAAIAKATGEKND